MPIVASLLGQQDGKHMVATICVYFHPARSKGSMIEAIGCAIVAFLYAVFVSFSSMGTSIFFGRTLEMIVLGHVIVLVVFCGGGLGFVGWTKQKLSHPLVNISCSLTSLAIITVITKEGAVQAAEFSDDKIVQVMKMIAMGVIATTAVSLFIYPVSATEDLRGDFVLATDSFGDMLASITRAFLAGSEEELEQRPFIDASDKYKKVSASMSKNLKEAKYEHFVVGREQQHRLEVRLVDCMQRLAQSIGGLRSAARTQFLLLTQCGVSIPATPSSSNAAPTPKQDSLPFLSSPSSPSADHRMLTAINELPEDEIMGEDTDNISLSPTIRSSSDIFTRFIVHLGPSMV